MRLNIKVIIAGVLAVTGIGFSALPRKQTTNAEAVGKHLALQADSFLMAARSLQTMAAKAPEGQTLQQQFIKLRLTYKRLEWAVEYFDPLTTRQVNGPPVPEAELTGQVIQPAGLQVIEALLFLRYNPVTKKQLLPLLQRLVVNAAEYRDYFDHAELQDWQVLDAVKLEVFRVETLGLNNFDDPLAGNCFAESAVALNSVEQVAGRYAGKDKDRLGHCFRIAVDYLLKPGTFDGFNRAIFLADYANPLTRALTHERKLLHMPDIRYNRLLNQDAATLFATDAFNRNAYIAAPGDSATALKIALGKKLFFDPLLSGTMTRSCASCHQPDKAFTDGLAKNLDITGKKTIKRNTPTLINAALQPALFYDLRAASLEAQVSDVVGNRDEMHGDMQLSTRQLWSNPQYRKLFGAAFPVKKRVGVDTAEVMNALASYVRSLTALNSRFDIYMRGDRTALSPKEIEGFNIFMGKANCSTCHYLPLFNGTLPPRYMQMDAEVIGVPETSKGKVIDPDPGQFDVIPQAFNMHAFKVPTVRNTTKTAPYMHNGVFKTMNEVINFYDLGGGAGQGLKVGNQTLPTAPLHLKYDEKGALIAFMKSLATPAQ